MATTGSVQQNVAHGAGRIFVRIAYTTDFGDVVVQDSVLPDTTNLTTWMAARIPEIEAVLAANEVNDLLDK